ncbi:hypothetical protein [Streptomyces sp. LN549]|uniref:hypothetical protein n=1 Tax=Streptomyces sp. LN549 TaxID=3112979 RepID=UPI003717A7DD
MDVALLDHVEAARARVLLRDRAAIGARRCQVSANRALAERWHAHHQEHAVLGLLSAKENLRRPHL